MVVECMAEACMAGMEEDIQECTEGDIPGCMDEACSLECSACSEDSLLGTVEIGGCLICAFIALSVLQ